MPNEPKWTPGPWKASSVEDGSFDILGVTASGTVPTIVACLCESSCSSEEDAANARLIAAAPELYEALEELLAAECNDQAYGASVEAIAAMSAVKKARAALLKANPDIVIAHQQAGEPDDAE